MLDHPGIVPVYEIGEHGGQKYFSMKLVRGGSLSERLATYADDPKAAASLIVEVAEAVHHAHMRGILHRDLKPANILIDIDGHCQITDFGLAKRVEADAEMTANGAILGTPAYMAPEQAVGRRGTITTATDVYGLGSVLYTLLTGHAPVTGDSVVDTLTMVKEKPPERPRKLNARVPRDMEVICLKCLEKDPRRRYVSAQAVAEDLRAWLENQPPDPGAAGRPFGENDEVGTAAPGNRGPVGSRRSRLPDRNWWNTLPVARSGRGPSRGRGKSPGRGPGRSDSPRGYAWSPDNRLVATAADEPLVRLWDAATGGLILQFEGHAEGVYALSFSPDGKRLATGSTDETARVWNVATGASVSTFKHKEHVYAVAWSPDSQLVATGCSDRMLRIWDPGTGNERLSL